MQTEQLPRLEAGEYPGGIWYYEPHTYQPYRYVLGRVGRHPLVCIGINPSTAQPGALDPTLKSVERLAAANGFDSWIMFNVYPQRATDPNDMDKIPDRALCHENLRWLKAVLAETEPTMWAAWGTLIEKRDYLPSLMREMVALTRERDIPWVTFGKRSKKGHPHHPLYLRKDSTPEPFDVENYLDTCFDFSGGLHHDTGTLSEAFALDGGPPCGQNGRHRPQPLAPGGALRLLPVAPRAVERPVVPAAASGAEPSRS